MKIQTEFRKFNNTQQIAYGVVYTPLEADSQGDWMAPEEIEKTAHTFTARGYVDQIDRNHDGRASGARVVESFIARKGDPVFPEGAWAIGVKTPDDVWQQIQAGELNGFSLYGAGRRIAKSLQGDPSAKFEIQDLDVTAVSLVKSAANHRTFAFKKADDMNDLTAVAAALNTIAKGMEKLLQQQGETVKLIGDELAKATNTDDAEYAAAEMAYRLDITGTVPPPARQHIAKAQQEMAVRNGAEIARHRSRIDALNREFERLGEGEISFERRDVRERHILREIEKSETELAALGYDNAARLDDPGRSSFFQRGGSSNFLVSSDSFPDDDFGLMTRRTRELKKAEVAALLALGFRNVADALDAACFEVTFGGAFVWLSADAAADFATLLADGFLSTFDAADADCLPVTSLFFATVHLH